MAWGWWVEDVFLLEAAVDMICCYDLILMGISLSGIHCGNASMYLHEIVVCLYSQHRKYYGIVGCSAHSQHKTNANSALS